VYDTVNSIAFEVVVVDNASTDNSRNYLRTFENQAGYQIIYNEKNLGFVGGNNIGMKMALQGNSDYIVLLNDDTVVDPSWLSELVKVAENDKTIGAVQSLLLYHDKPEIVNSWGNYMHFLGFAFSGGNLEKLPPDFKLQEPKKITYCSGAAVLYRVNLLKAFGFFDPSLESYHEDADICLRMRLWEYSSYLAPKSVVYHKYKFMGARITLKGKYKYYLMERNRLYILLKYYSPKTLLLIFPAWLAMELGLFLFAIFRGFWLEKIKGYFWIFSHLYLISKRRHCGKSPAGIDNRKLMEDFVSAINYQEINNPVLKYIGNPLMNLYWWLIKKVI